MTYTGAIVIAGDKQHQLERDLLARQLETASCRIVLAESAEECKELIEKHFPEWVLIDASLPGGMPLIEEIRSRPAGPAVLAWVHSDEVAALMRQSGTGVVDSRDGFDAMLRVIERATGSGRAAASTKESVLVVDDDPEIRNMLAEFLRDRKYSVSTAGSSLEAMEVLDRNPFIAVVLLDVMMPDKGGLQTLADISQRSPHPTVMMISALSDGVIARHAIDLGAFDYHLKPFDLELLETSVSTAASDYVYRNGGSGRRR